MTFYTYKPVPMGPGENIFYRTSPTSALNSFAAAGMYGRAARARGRFRRRVPGVTDINATLIAFGPLGKSDADEGLVIQSSLDEDFNLIKSSGEISEAERKIALATNTAGVIAGPAAVYAAYKGAREGKGSWPRGAARWAANSKRVPDMGPRTTAARKKLAKVIRDADAKPVSGKAKAVAGGVGATMVGLQLANTTGDFIAARAMKGAKRTDKES